MTDTRGIPAGETGRVARRLPVDPGPSGWNEILPTRPAARELDEDITADWLVIGAGFAGLAAARRLRQLYPEDRVVLLEAKRVGEGPAGRNSGFMIDLPHDLNSDSYGGAAAADRLGEPYAWLDAKGMHELTGTRFYRAGLHTPGAVMLQLAAFVRGVAAGLFSAVCQNGLGTTKGTFAGFAAPEQASGLESENVADMVDHPAPQRLFPEPFMWLGANAYLRWQHRKARGRPPSWARCTGRCRPWRSWTPIRFTESTRRPCTFSEPSASSSAIRSRWTTGGVPGPRSRASGFASTGGC